MSRTLGMIYSDREYFSIAKTFSKSIFGLETTKIDSIVVICVNSNILNIGVGQEWQDTIPEMVPQHPCYQQMKPRHLGLISSLT